MPIKEADKSYDHDKIEKKVQKFWKEEETFKKVNELNYKELIKYVVMKWFFC